MAGGELQVRGRWYSDAGVVTRIACEDVEAVGTVYGYTHAGR